MKLKLCGTKKNPLEQYGIGLSYMPETVCHPWRFGIGLLFWLVVFEGKGYKFDDEVDDE